MGSWIPCKDRPPETNEAVIVTWANNEPESYYEHIKGKRFTGAAHYHNKRWWWDSPICQDYLDEYGESEPDRVDDGIEIVAWMHFPEPYKEETDEQRDDN